MSNDDLCMTCGERPVYAKRECRRCYEYRRRTGKERPEIPGCLTAEELVEAAADIVNYRRSLYRVSQKFGCSATTLKNALLGKTEIYAEVAEGLPMERIREVIDYYRAYHPGILTAAQVREIRRRRARGALLVELAEEYGVDAGIVSRLVRGETYADAGGPIEGQQAAK